MKTAKTTLIICSVLTLFLSVLYFVYLAKVVLIYLLVALLLAIAITPLVRKLERRNIGRVTATTLSMGMIFLIFIAVIAAIITPLVSEGTQLVRNFPTITSEVLANPYVNTFVTNTNLKEEITQLSNNAPALLFGSSSKILVITKSFLSFISSTAVVFVFTFLLIIEGELLWSRFLSFFSPSRRKQAEKAAAEISRAVSGFISGNLFISAIAGTVTLITLYILKVPYTFALAALVAVFDLIPLVGASIATVAVGFVALTQGPIVALIAVAVLIFYQFVEGNFIQPLVYSKSINLSPLLIIIASIVGAEVAGIGGVLLAIPMAAILSILAAELHDIYMESRKA